MHYLIYNLLNIQNYSRGNLRDRPCYYLPYYLAVSLGLCRPPGDINWRHIASAGMLGGIGFTMSIFITNHAALINTSKMAILVASLTAGLVGYTWLRLCRK